MGPGPLVQNHWSKWYLNSLLILGIYNNQLTLDVNGKSHMDIFTVHGCMWVYFVDSSEVNLTKPPFRVVLNRKNS